MSIELEFEGSRHAVSDVRDLVRQLKQLHENRKASPAIVHLIAPDRSTLNIAVGGARSFLNYISPGGWPASHSVGDESAKGVEQYRVAGEITEIDARCTIPFQLALDAAVEFFSTAKATAMVTWEGD